MLFMIGSNFYALLTKHSISRSDAEIYATGKNWLFR